jgi:hypothetical protein
VHHRLDVWVYRGNDWLVGKADAPHVAHEAWTVKFEPKVVTDVAEQLDQVSKVVGVSDDLDAVQRCEATPGRPSGSARRPTARSPIISM